MSTKFTLGTAVLLPVASAGLAQTPTPGAQPAATQAPTGGLIVLPTNPAPHARNLMEGHYIGITQEEP